MTTTTRRPNKTLRRSLTSKILILSQEAAECTTDAAYRCVMESVADAQRQLKAELGDEAAERFVRNEAARRDFIRRESTRGNRALFGGAL